MLLSSILLYAFAFLLLYVGIGGISALITSIVVFIGQQTVSAIKTGESEKTMANFAWFLLSTVSGFIFLGMGTAFLTAYLMIPS